MYSKISKFSEIIPGFNFRSAIEADTKGDTYIIQAKNIVQGETISSIEGLTPISFPGKRTNAFLEKDDIVIVSRGTGIGSFRAAIYQSDSTNVIATGSLLILRVSKKEILPAYVCLYLNSDDGQKKIIETISGATIQSISTNKFRDIDIPIISLKQQKSITDLHANIREQERIYTRKKELKHNLLTVALKNLIHS